MKCSQFDAMCRLKGNCFQRLKALKDVGPKFTVVNFFGKLFTLLCGDDKENYVVI